MKATDFGLLRIGCHVRLHDAKESFLTVGKVYEVVGWHTPSGHVVGTTNQTLNNLVTVRLGPESKNCRNGWWNLNPEEIELEDEAVAETACREHGANMLKKIAEMTELHDVQIHTEGQCLTAPGFLLSAASPVLKAMLSSDMTEARSRTIMLKGVSAAAAKALVHFVFHGVLCAEGAELGEVAVLADKYDMPSLLSVALHEIPRTVTADTVVPIAQELSRLKHLPEGTEAFERLNGVIRGDAALSLAVLDAACSPDTKREAGTGASQVEGRQSGAWQKRRAQKRKPQRRP